MSKRISFKVDGEVQGVGYRNFAEKQAQKLGLTGFVQNDPAGHVSGEAQGDESALQEFVKHLNKGPSAASVNGVEQKEISTKEGESGFSS